MHNPATIADLPDGIVRAISREEMALLPIRRYEGDVSQVSSAADLARALEDIRQESVVGFDTETRPAFQKGESHLPCLVQVATARRVHLFSLRQPEVFPLLAEMLAQPGSLKVGIALANDLRSLKQVFAFEERSVLDLGVVARRLGLTQTGLRNLAGIFLGFRVPKGARTSNWAAPRLTAAQVNYAATDAWACRELLLRFRELNLLQ
ncbi:MAG: 3'-5' exonuclease domain-containing protein 2 [Proteobacteria bacterium]|nr:3'-5' exonuclease domain-containing protein 2 [Pseudomonadota bacterium]